MPMSIVLLGILTALAGFAALAFGIQNWAFGIGNTLIASGSIGAVGGLLLVGLGLVLRSLRMLVERIDNLTPAVAAEFQVPLVPQELPLEAEMPVSLPPARWPIRDEEDEAKPTREVAYRRDEQFKRVRDVASRIAAEPKSARIERPAPTATVDQPLESEPPQSREQSRAWPPRTATRVEEAAQKEKKEKKSWDRPRPASRLRVPPPPQAFTPPPAPEPEPEPLHEPEPEPMPMSAAAPATVAVMRSGIISGMAYTLYADGSIEAELPLGTVRFGSVEELRAHVARSGTDADAEFSGRPTA